jgi:hypothetical protein
VGCCSPCSASCSCQPPPAPDFFDDPDAECFDRNRATIAAGVDMPPSPFQNRPTFQQTVELTRALPR